jgi:hypothetical protein
MKVIGEFFKINYSLVRRIVAASKSKYKKMWERECKMKDLPPLFLTRPFPWLKTPKDTYIPALPELTNG